MAKKVLNTNSELLIALDQFRNKAGAWQSQAKADKLLLKLKELLPENEYWKLCIAHSHYNIGEGAEELYDVCKELYAKYSKDPS